MIKITWQDDFLINVSRIDSQHKHLSQMVDELNQAVEDDLDEETLKRLLSQIIEETKYHFGTEEELMLNHLYPHYENHKMAHEALISYLEETEHRMLMGKQFNFQTNFKISCDCFITHMQESDRHLGEFLNAKQIY